MQHYKISDGPEHRRQLRETVASFAARSATPEKLRATLAMGGGFDVDRWAECADSGWLSLLVPESHDGIGLDGADLSAFHQEIGRCALREPLIDLPLLVCEALVRGENTALTARLLPELISGERLATLAWQGGHDSFLPGDTGPTAARSGAQWYLQGEAHAVRFAAQASGGVVAAHNGRGVMLIWLDALPDPIAATAQADGTLLSTIDFTGVSFSEADVIASAERGAAVLGECLSLARIAIAAQLLGAAEKVLNLTLDYLKTRRQFGQPLGNFQALQHRAVDLFVGVEIARSSLERAEQALASGSAQATALIHAAKARSTDVARKVARESIQLHGAIGYTEEYDLSLFVNRILTLSVTLGTTAQHRAAWFADTFSEL